MSEYRFRLNDPSPLTILKNKRVNQCDLDQVAEGTSACAATVFGETEPAYTQGSYSLVVPNLGSFLDADTPKDPADLRSWLDLAPGEDLDAAEYHRLAAAFLEISKRFQSLSGDSDGEESGNTKSIGVNSHWNLCRAIERYATNQGVTNARAARDLFSTGLEKLENDLEEKSSRSVFEQLLHAYDQYRDRPREATKQWQLRVDRYAYGSALLLGKEYGFSLSKLARFVIANQLLETFPGSVSRSEP